MNIQKHAQNALQFIGELAEDLGLEKDLDKAGRLLRYCLLGLRDMLTVQESFDMISQLPLFIKGIYVDGWKINEHKEKVKTPDQLIDVIVQHAGQSALREFESREMALPIIQTVFRMIKRHISQGEIDDITAILSKKIGQLWATA